MAIINLLWNWIGSKWFTFLLPLYYIGSHLQRVKRCKRNCCNFFTLQSVNYFHAKKSARYSQVLVVTELVVSGTQYTKFHHQIRWGGGLIMVILYRLARTCDGQLYCRVASILLCFARFGTGYHFPYKYLTAPYRSRPKQRRIQDFQ